MSTVYLVTIANVETDEFVAFAYGEFPTMNFAAKAGLAKIKDADGEFSAKVVEVENYGTDEAKRSVVSVSGDAETVTVVLKKKIANERKQYLAETGSTGDAPAEDAPAEDETV
jgi:hypothetical protein